MDAQGPSNGQNPGGAPPGKGATQSGNRQEVVDLFGSDVYTAFFTLMLLLLGLTHAAMTRCECL
jgi:hypothetical protein